MAKHIIFGAAGTGKTTKLISILEEQFNKGLKPSDVCFCTYSRAAANEAKDRVMSKFNFKKEDIPYFGTMHAICYKRFFLGKKPINSKQKDMFFKKEGIGYDIIEDDEDLLTNEAFSDKPGNILLGFYDKLRISYCKDINSFKSDKGLQDAFNLLHGSSFDILFMNGFSLFKVLQNYESYKKELGVIDFVDMILEAYKQHLMINTQILIVDEFQDLSPLQYEIYKLWSENKSEVYLAGDDDQTIYNFICANSEFLLEERKKLKKEKGDEEIILDKTYRLPKEINEMCKEYLRNNIRHENRIDKDITSHKNGGEIVEDYIGLNLHRVLEFIRPDKFTFILTRTNYYKRVLIDEVLVPNGIIYHEIRGKSIWNDRTINIYNACFKILNRIQLEPIEVEYLIKNIPFKFGLLKKGLKSNFKSLMKKEKYSISDMLEIGFSFNLFTLDSYDRLYSVLDISDSLKKSFIAKPSKIIEYPIRIRIGTIHSSKGKEAEDVILFKDVSKRVAIEASKDKKSWEDEMRVFYVGQSRCKERLVILRGGFVFGEPDFIP